VVLVVELHHYRQNARVCVPQVFVEASRIQPEEMEEEAICVLAPLQPALVLH
jgi:hypothetical protein